jgi:hypothetical protein
VTSVRQLAVELLATPNQDRCFGHSHLTRTLAQRAGCRPFEAQEALWGLVSDGLAFIDSAAAEINGPEHWEWKLTQAGIHAASGGSREPADVDGFLRRLRRRAPDVDPAALVYLEEDRAVPAAPLAPSLTCGDAGSSGSTQSGSDLRGCVLCGAVGGGHHGPPPVIWSRGGTGASGRVTRVGDGGQHVPQGAGAERGDDGPEAVALVGVVRARGRGEVEHLCLRVERRVRIRLRQPSACDHERG